MRPWKFKDTCTIAIIIFSLGASFSLFRQESIAQENPYSIDQTVTEKLEKGQLLAPGEIERVRKIQNNHAEGKIISKREQKITKMAKESLPQEAPQMNQTDQIILKKMNSDQMLSPSDLQRVQDLRDEKLQAKDKSRAIKRSIPAKVQKTSKKYARTQFQKSQSQQKHGVRADTP